MKKHSYTLLVAFAVLSLIGLLSLPRLSVQLDPSPDAGNLTVEFGWEGVSPEVMERQVTTPLEGALGTLRGVRRITSESSYGWASITLELDQNAPADRLRFEAAMLVRQLYPGLPRQVSYPAIRLNAPGQNEQQKPLLILQLNGNAPSSDLQRLAEEQLKPRLAQVEGIYGIEVHGGNRTEWVLEYDQRQLESLRLTEAHLADALRNQLAQASLGTATLDNGNQVPVGLAPPAEAASGAAPSGRGDAFPFGSGGGVAVGGRLVHLSDLVAVSRQEQPPVSFHRINGRNAVNLTLSADAGVNQISLRKAVFEKLASLTPTLPPGYHVSTEYDATEYIQENLQKIYIQTGAALVILLLFVWATSLSWRYTVFIVLGLVVNLALSFIAFYLLGIQIHLYSLAALTTSLGILIDNTIVMIDHYRRYRNLDVFTALLGATLTTIAGLSVIYFLPEPLRFNLLDFAVVMIVTLAVSLLVALFFIPALMERWDLRLRRPGPARIRTLRRLSFVSRAYSRMLRFLLRFRKTAFLAAVLAFGLPVFLLPARLDGNGFWTENYNAFVGGEWYAEHAQPVMNKALGGTLRLFAQYVYEKSYYAKPERTALYIQASLPNQSTIEQTDEVFVRMERHLAQYPQIDRFITSIYNGQNGSLVVYFKPEHENGPFPYLLKGRAIALSTEMSGINWNIYGVGLGFSQNLDGNAAPTFRVALYGYNYNELERQANVLKQKLEAHPRVQQVDINKSRHFWNQKNLYEYVLDTDAEKMALYAIDKQRLYDALSVQGVRSQPDLHRFINGAYEPIKLVPRQSLDFDVWRLNHEPVRLDSHHVKAAGFARISKQPVSPDVYKEDQQYMRVVGFEYFGGALFGEKFLDKTLLDMRAVLPLGYTARKMDTGWWGGQSRTQYELLALVAVLIYVVCAVIFESLRQPLALVLLIPLSFIGVFLAFYWFDFNFDQGGYAAFVLLSGNVVCAAIFVIAEYNTLRKLHPRQPALRVYVRAFNHKIVPILLTVLSTVAGLVPFLIYGQDEAFWFALGAGTIGGLLMSLAAIVLYLPLLLGLGAARR